MGRALDVTTSYIASTVRLTAGLYARPNRRRPEKPVELYEFEACPFCRKVREALSELDLDAIVYPCPKGGKFREIVKAKTGKTMFPFLIDPNSGTEMLESNDIVRYLEKTYGESSVSWPLSLGPLTNFSSMLASAARPMHGFRARPSRRPEKMVELWSFEASPYCRLVRETLCELEIPYLLHNVAKKGQMRRAFVERSGKMRVPYLYDPNTGREMFESADIVRYLEDTYAVGG